MAKVTLKVLSFYKIISQPKRKETQEVESTLQKEHTDDNN